MGMSDCKLCGLPTICIFNIELKQVPICEVCALAITKQEVESWVPLREKVESLESALRGNHKICDMLTETIKQQKEHNKP